MLHDLIPVAVIVMAGVLLTTVAWQVLGIARDRVRAGDRDTAAQVHDLDRRVTALEHH